MLKQILTLVVVMCSLLSLKAQTRGLEAFQPLVGHTWAAEGKWSNGDVFKQEVQFAFDLDETIVLAETYGYTDDTKTQFGKRNHGVRLFNFETQRLEFSEFDRFGGVTTGTIRIEGKSIYYQYAYGGTDLTDCWEYVDANTYKFTVGVYNNGVWTNTYLQTVFKLKQAK